MAIPKFNGNQANVNSVPPVPQNSSPKPSMPKGKKSSGSSNTFLPLIVLVLLLAVAVGVLGYLYYDSKKEIDDLKTQNQLEDTSEEYAEIVEKIKQLVVIDENERVNIARIDKPELLFEQDPKFYADVQAGQYLVVLPQSQRVMIYDKSANRIVNFSSYTIKVDLIPEEEIPESEKPLTIEIIYSEGVSQETIDQVVEALSNASANYSVINTRPAAVSHEGLSLVLLNRDAKPNMSQNLVAHTGTNSILETMPEGEAGSQADAVLILGTQ